MIELYAAVILLGIGHVVNLKKRSTILPDLEPSAPYATTSVYESNQVEIANDAEAKAVKAAAAFQSELLGTTLPPSERVHNNMEPFYRGSGVNQPKHDNSGVLESFAATDDANKIQKAERGALFEPRPNVYESIDLQSVQDRTYVSNLQNNILPFKQETVGPGLDSGYGSKPVGGLNQTDPKLIRPKTVDELRIASKPKSTFEGRIIDGLKGLKQTIQGAVNVNDTKKIFKEQGQDDLLTTTGAVIKPTMQSSQLVKDTQRQSTTTKTYQSAAKITGQGRKESFDYGKASIQVYDNKRDVTTVNTHSGNVSSLVKSMVVPLQDSVRPARKKIVDNPRPDGGNVTTQIKSTIILPEVQADTRKAVIENLRVGNAGQTVANVTVGPDDVMRTTIKETVVHDSQLGNVQGHKKAIIYDPEQVTRTTLKETLIHDGTESLANLAPISRVGYTLNEDDAARQTVRETLDDLDTATNFQTSVKNQTVVQQDGVRQTNKEMYVGDDVGPGMPQTTTHANAGYINSTINAPATRKDKQSEYFGSIAQDMGSGYAVANFEAPDTLRQTPQSYYGITGPEHIKPTDGTSVTQNARLRTAALVVDHKPTPNNVKVASGAKDMNAYLSKVAVANPNRSVPQIDAKEDRQAPINFTRDKPTYDDQSSRLDPDILEPYRVNPYTLGLPSV